MMSKISFFLGLQISQSPRGIFINQSKYALESLKKYDFESCDPVDTPMVEKFKLNEDKEGKAIDPSHYRGMIGTLLYLTASRPDLQFAICMCARYQARPTEKPIHAVKRIFGYLHGTVNQGLWTMDTAIEQQVAMDETLVPHAQRTMDTTIDQQVAIDEALVPHARRLRIRRSNFLLLSDIRSKESTLQLVYDATATVHHHSIRFKMDNKKHIINLVSFREMLHISPRIPHKPFIELPFEEEILAFLRFLGHSGAIKRLTNVNVNKLHQPWRSFAAIINKCPTRKSSGYDSLRLSQAQILWGLYHKRNVDFAYLMWEDFVYQVEHKDTKKSKEMYYPRNSNAYKEHYAVTTGGTPSKPKASVRKTRSSPNTTITPPTDAAGPRLTTFKKGKQAAKASKAKSLSALSEVAMTEAQ
nr:uncharacterized mitochondrial protein AtMg00810-like [Tanacetum cinerariifolium]